jgi:hypothetical protein
MKNPGSSCTAPAATIRPKARGFRSRRVQREEPASDVSNRNWLKNRSYRKHTTKPCLTGARIGCQRRANSVAEALSNRELSTNRDRSNSPAASTLTFLTGSASQTEFAITHSKQTTPSILTGSRIVNSTGIHPERSSRRAQYRPGIDTSFRLAQDGAQLK